MQLSRVALIAISMICLLALSVGSGAAGAAEPDVIDDPPAAFDPAPAPLPAAAPEVEVTAPQAPPPAADVAPVVVVPSAPASTRAPAASAGAGSSATYAPPSAAVTRSGSLPFTGVDAGLLMLLSLAAMLLIIAGVTLRLAAPSGASVERR